jgi:hypothetical protein
MPWRDSFTRRPPSRPRGSSQTGISRRTAFVYAAVKFPFPLFPRFVLFVSSASAA